MQKNNHSVRNVKTLVFMALLVAMQLVLSRIFVIELGPYHIYGRNRMYSAGRSLDGTCGRWYLRRLRGHHWMLYQGICGKSVYYTCSNSLGGTPGACKEILCKQIQNR